jgi:outer membrane immunogenic protein
MRAIGGAVMGLDVMPRKKLALNIRALKIMAGAGALAWMSAVGPVSAADIPAAPVYKAPVAAPVQNWYGFFIGVSGGYAWGRNAVETTAVPPFTPFLGATSAFDTWAGNPSGGLFGLQWGSNWQFNRFVLGTIGDIYWSDIKASQTKPGAFGGLPGTSTADQHLKWFGTTRLRGGVLVTDNFLLYASGGLASGRGESNFTSQGAGCAIVVCPFGSGSKNMWGWAAGGGVEYLSGPWSARVEYLHYDLGTLSYSVAPPAPVFFNSSVRMSGDMVLGSISYKFNWTPLGLLFGSDRL